MKLALERLTAARRHPGTVVLALAAYLPFLGQMSVPLTGDQKAYIAISMEMLERKSFWVPYLMGEPNFLKPPFQYWMTILGWQLFGINFWGTFLPSVFALIATAWFLGEIGRMVSERSTAPQSGFWFAASLGTATFGTVAQMEVWLCFFYAAAWWAALKYLAAPRGSRRPVWLFVAFAITGVSALNKSPLYSALWVVGFVTYLLIVGEWELLRQRRFYLATALGIVIGSSWFIALLAFDSNEESARLFSEYLVRETWAKKSGNSGTALSLWLALLYFSLPFTLLLIPSAISLWRRRSRATGMLRLALSWAWAPALFFSLYPYRVKTYLYVLLPVCAMIVDHGFLRTTRSRLFQRFLWATGALLFVVTSLSALLVFRAGLAPAWVSFCLAASGLIGLVSSLRGSVFILGLATLFSIVSYRGVATQLGETDIRGLREWVATAPAKPIAMWDDSRNIWHEVGLLSVALGRGPGSKNGPAIARLHEEADVINWLADGGRLILSDRQDAERIKSLVQTGRGGVIEVRGWHRWKIRKEFPLVDVLLKGRAGIPDFDELTQREYKLLGRAGRI